MANSIQYVGGYCDGYAGDMEGMGGGPVSVICGYQSQAQALSELNSMAGSNTGSNEATLYYTGTLACNTVFYQTGTWADAGGTTGKSTIDQELNSTDNQLVESDGMMASGCSEWEFFVTSDGSGTPEFLWKIEIATSKVKSKKAISMNESSYEYEVGSELLCAVSASASGSASG